MLLRDAAEPSARPRCRAGKRVRALLLQTCEGTSSPVRRPGAVLRPARPIHDSFPDRPSGPGILHQANRIAGRPLEMYDARQQRPRHQRNAGDDWLAHVPQTLREEEKRLLRSGVK